jgi:D-alanyl-D-alanine carboxypeptidase (penicillin-binding protein 5/6)
MTRESQEKILSDVEKTEFVTEIKIENKFARNVLFFFATLVVSCLILFGFNFLSFFLAPEKEYIHQSKTALAESLKPNDKLTQIYDLNYNYYFPPFDVYSAKSIVLYDISSNKIIYEKNSSQKSFIASLTKLASTKVVADNIDLIATTTIGDDVQKYNGSILKLQPGQTFTNRDLLKASIIDSNNEALYSIQDPEKTVEQLNSYAKVLNLKTTNFTNPVGFDDELNFSTARDLLPIANVFFGNSFLKDFAGTSKSEVTDLNENKSLRITNTNELLRADNPYVVAGKTGTTPRAGQNLALLIDKRDRRYILIILGSADRYTDANKVINAL